MKTSSIIGASVSLERSGNAVGRSGAKVDVSGSSDISGASVDGEGAGEEW